MEQNQTKTEYKGIEFGKTCSNDAIVPNNIVQPVFKEVQATCKITKQVFNIKWSGNDEFYTPAYAIEPILKYLKPNSTIWCPFDLPESLFVKKLTEAGHNVIATHIAIGQDFFTTPVPKCDYVISNPPYSVKVEVLERLFEIGKPFMMLVGIIGLFESQRKFHLFKNNEFEIMYLSLRVAYFKDYTEQKLSGSPPFSSVYVCAKVLPKQIVFEEINKRT